MTSVYEINLNYYATLAFVCIKSTYWIMKKQGIKNSAEKDRNITSIK